MDHEEYIVHRLRRSIAIGVMVAIAVFSGVESIDLMQTFSNETEINQNYEQSIENKEKLIELEWKIKNIESTKTGEFDSPRLCTCVAEDNNKKPRIKVCPTRCDTTDAIYQCEEINKGYQCG